MDKQKSKKEKEDYCAEDAIRVIMERSTENTKISLLKENILDKGLCSWKNKRQELEVSLNTDSQTERIILELQEFIIERIGPHALERHLPDLSKQEISARAIKMFLGPLKQSNPGNSFGGEWNEWTANIAAKRIGISEHKLLKTINKPGKTGSKLRSEQASVSMEITAAFRRAVENGTFSEAAFLVKTETWLHQSIVSLREQLKSDDNLTKTEKEMIITDTLRAFLSILAFAEGQEIDTRVLLKTLLNGRMGKSVNIVNLQCMTFINSEIDGICVTPTARDVEVVTAKGNKLVISQNDSLDEVCRFARILHDGNIAQQITIIVFDNDKIVLPGQEKNILLFMEDFQSVVDEHAIGGFPTRIVLGSNMVDPGIFRHEWDRRISKGDKLAENLVNTEFERLQDKTLPCDQKSRSFAREIARRGFQLQAALGATLPLEFDNMIILQRTKAQQQASEVLKLGSDLHGVKPPLVIAHWKKRSEV